MADKYVLDTHALIWYLEGNPKLSSRAKGIIDDPDNSLILPIIALAEAVWGRSSFCCCAVGTNGVSGETSNELKPTGRITRREHEQIQTL